MKLPEVSRYERHSALAIVRAYGGVGICPSTVHGIQPWQIQMFPVINLCRMELYLQGLSFTHSQRWPGMGKAEENGWQLEGQQAAAEQVMICPTNTSGCDGGTGSWD